MFGTLVAKLLGTMMQRHFSIFWLILMGILFIGLSACSHESRMHGGVELDPLQLVIERAVVLSETVDSPQGQQVTDFCEANPLDPFCQPDTVPGGNNTPELITESFQQGVDNNKVDILWVIDDSTSMQEEQEAVAENFTAFIDHLNAAGTDYQIGVTTTTQRNDGFILGVLTPETPNFDQVVQDLIHVGEDGFGFERGLEMARAAFSIRNAEENAGFLREDAALAIIIVSDENDEHSFGSVETDIAFFEHEIKENSDHVTLYAVVPPRGEFCPVDADRAHRIAVGGDRYIDVAEGTGGFAVNICDGNFAEDLSAIGQGINTMLNHFELEALPVLESIVVQIDEEEISQDDINGWSYAADKNAIILHGTAVPAAHSRITVSYQEQE